MSEGDLADSARGTSGSNGSRTPEAAVITPTLPGNKSLVELQKNNSQHVPYVAAAPDVSTTIKTTLVQPRSGYKSSSEGQKYFDPYDPWIGIRTAIILGGFLMLIVVYILYKARCRLSGSIEVNKVSYYQEYKERCRERILSNIRARNNLAHVVERALHYHPHLQQHQHPEAGEGGGGGEAGVASLDLTAKWIQSQPLCSAIPDESGEVKTPNINRNEKRLHLSDTRLQASSPDLRSPPGGHGRNKALLDLLQQQESSLDHFSLDHRNFTAIGEFPTCDGKVPNTDVANSSDLTYLSGQQSPPLSNTHFHKPLIHHVCNSKDSELSIDENSNVPPAKLNVESVQIEMVPLDLSSSSPLSHGASSKDDINNSAESDSAKSVKSALSDTTASPEQRTSSQDTPLTSESRMRSQSHSSLIPSASSMSSGLELMDPLKLINGGPKLLQKKSRSNGNIVTMKFDSQYTLWKPPNDSVTKL